MNIHTQHYIDQYINKELSNIEADIFEKRLRNDAEFRTNYETQINLIEGMRRVEMKTEILKARKRFYQLRILRVLMIVALVILGLLVSYHFLKQNKDVENINVVHKESLNEQEPIHEVVFVRDSSFTEIERSNFFSVVINRTKSDTTFLGQKTVKDIKKSFPTIDKLCPNNKVIYIKCEEYKHNSVEYDPSTLYFEYDDTHFLKVLNQKTGCNEKPNKELFDSIYAKILMKRKNVTQANEETIEKVTTPPHQAKRIFDDLVYENKNLQKFYLKNFEKDTILIGKEGTEIKINKNSFSNIKSPIKIELKEYYQLSDILLANLSTHSGNKILETGGMIYLKATEVKTGKRIQPENPIQISFPTKDQKDMKLFNGKIVGDRLDWKLDIVIEDELDELTYTETESIEEVEIESKISSGLENYPTLPKCKKDNRYDNNKCINNQLLKQLQKKIELTNLYDFEVRRINIRFRISNQGDIVNIKVSPRNENAESEIKKALRDFPTFTPASQNGKNIDVNYIFQIKFDPEKNFNQRGIPKDSMVIRGFTRQNVNVRDNNIEKNNSSRELSNRIFSTTRLGWINCDRFINFQGQKINYALEITDHNETDIKLIFKNQKSILQGRNTPNAISFGSLPKGEEVYVVAFRKSENKLEFALKETTISPSRNLELKFQSSTVSEIRSKLKKLISKF